MTTPVLIDTAPENRTMSFIMPGKTVENGVPNPAGEDVTLGKVKAARFAVRRFGGGRTAENETGAVAKLRAWLGGQKLPAKANRSLPTTTHRGRPSSYAATKSC